MLIELAEAFNHLSVEISKISGTTLLWRDRSFETEGITDSEFLEKYSLVMSNELFSDQSRLQSVGKQTMFAERYGGFGLGVNGGGARVVGDEKVQIKGVGPNVLAGNGAPSSHSYGGLDIQGAVKEIIYSRLLSRISPVGVQGIYGLILLDETSARHNGENAPSVLLVRERVTRPAHFLPCINFKQKNGKSNLIPSDFSRILGIYKAIGKQALLSEFYALTQHFLERCADQLSFFQVARLSHNALSPSNISIDGRVLDTALCSFIVSGTNYGQVTSYFEEPLMPVVTVKEWFYLINKFLLEKPIEAHFLQLYEQKLYQYACINMGFVFGIDREMSTKLSGTVEWGKVSTRFLSLLSIGSPIKNSTLPTVNAVDFINDILTASLFSVLNNRKVKSNSKFLVEFSEDLSSLIIMLASSLGWHGQNERSFYKAITIQTVKRAILSSYFFITYIGRTVDEYYASGRTDNTAEIITENDHIAIWLYENTLSEHSTLFSGNEISIQYDCVADEFKYQNLQKLETRVGDISILREIIDTNKDNFTVQRYDFYPYLKCLASLLDGDAMNSFNGVKNVYC